MLFGRIYEVGFMLPSAFTDPKQPSSKGEEAVCQRGDSPTVHQVHDVTVGRHKNMQIGR